MKIVELRAYPTSFPLPPEANVTLGIGRAVKRDAVVVKVTTDDGLVGWGEAHHGRAPGAVAHLINTTLRQLVLGMDAADVVSVWKHVYRMQLGSHGMGAGASIGLSGIDMALWDIRAKAAGWPLYRLLGGGSRPIPAYAGGVSLGYQEPAKLVDEARALVAQGYRALKLRVGDTPERDLERVAAVRRALGDRLVILTDANTGYTVADARRAMPGLEAHGVGWLEEPFPAHDHRSYALAPARPLEDGGRHRGPADRRARLRVEALDQPPHLDDRPQHGGLDPLPGRDRERGLLRGGRLEEQSLPRPAHELALHARPERLRRSPRQAGPRRRGGRGLPPEAPGDRGARVRVAAAHGAGSRLHPPRPPPEGERGDADKSRAPGNDERRRHPERLGDRADHERAERKGAAEHQRVQAHDATA